MASRWWPKTLTMLWPVNISSTWPPTSPVRSHCTANSFCDRRAIRMVTANEIGTTITEMAASSGLIQNIMMSTPTMVSSDVISVVSACCSDCAMLSRSLVRRDSTSPWGWSSK